MKNIIFLFIGLFSISCFSQSDNLYLMPWPKEIKVHSGNFQINPDFTIGINKKPSKRIEIATTKFLRRLSGRTGVFIENGFLSKSYSSTNNSLNISYDSIGKLEINEDESYELSITNNIISLKANTDIGVIYGLETLLQLVTNNDDFYYFPNVNIKDEPRFTWRGLMIDVARHFEPVDVLKRNLDAMASLKMNVFHWHLTDDQGFRIESKTRPELHELASDGLYYTQEQIKDIVQFAGDRGIRVVPEVDVPGHGTAILTAFPEIGSKEMTYSIERNSGIFDPTLDPTNEKTYEILGDLFGEMAQLFPFKYFHIGGDENEGKHWDESEHIQAFMKSHNLKTNHDLQTYFNIRLDKILSKYGKSVMGWEEIMTDNMPTTALIHSWRGVNEGTSGGSSLVKAAKKGHETVLSNGYYIDLMQPASEHYLVDPMPNSINLTKEEKSRILGGEATMWSELVTQLNIDSRIWPRTAAIAERFWSDASINDISSMYKRLHEISFRLEELGITHIRNRDVILRNIAKNQNIEALIMLTKIYEPVKIYTRNQGGIEYKTFSPFTLFADACTADASDGIIFNNLVTNYISTSNNTSKEEIIYMLNNWANNYNQFSQIINNNPILKSIVPISKNLSEISKSLIPILKTETIKIKDYETIKSQYLNLKRPIVDVEFASLNSIKLLIEHFTNKNKLKLDLNNTQIQQ
jgi:hexosaminidase